MPPKRRAPSTSDLDLPTKASNKRARFAEPEDDDGGRFAEEVDASLDMAGGAGRKGGVKVDGYESDSTDDGEGVVLSRRKGKDDDEDDDDMFAVEDKSPGKGDAASGKKKPTRYLKLGEIEGQEFNESGDDGSDVSSDEPEDEDDAERRKKAGMGFDVTKFHMKEEMEEGKFAEDGMYVRSFDAHAVHDRWMEGLGEKEMKKARKAKRKAERLEKERIREEEAQKSGASGETKKSEMEKELLSLIKPGESVLEALARLGKEKKKSAKGKAASKSDTKDAVVNQKVSDIDRITALASSLMVSDIDIYSTTYEALLRSVRRSGIVPQDWTPPITKYEYRWAIPESTGDSVYGPFTAEEMKGWYDASFFGLAGEKVVVRDVGGSEWAQWNDVFV